MGDLTTNHTGSGHDWFRAALESSTAPEREFFYWEEGEPGYASWLGHSSLPKLNYSSPELWERLITGPGSVTRRWLQPPYELDGWRIDVANMTGRFGHDDMTVEVARAMRRSMGESRPGSLLLAEHGHDYTSDLGGDGWHGSMNYAGFTRPVWSWLCDPTAGIPFLGQPVPVSRQAGATAVQTIEHFLARLPWSVATHNLNLLGSHDTARPRTVLGGGAMVEVAAAFLMCFPGIPMVFAGDEIGLEGRTGEDARRPYPWKRPERWDRGLLEAYKRLVRLRRSSTALTGGGLRWVHRGRDALCFLRESPEERMLVLLTRAPGPDIVVGAGSIGWSGEAVNRYGGAVLGAHDGKLTLPGDGPMAQIWQLA